MIIAYKKCMYVPKSIGTFFAAILFEFFILDFIVNIGLLYHKQLSDRIIFLKIQLCK